MNKNSEKKKRIWPFVWIVIFLSFIILDLGFKIFFSDEKIIYNFVIGGRAVKLSVLENGIFIGVKALKLIVISLNLIYSVINNRKDYSLNIALILTLLADTFLAVNPSSTLAVLVFCFVQYFHSVRFSDNKILNLVRATLMIVLLSVGYFVNIANIYAFAFVYMLLIVGNILLSFRLYEKEKQSASSVQKTRLAFLAFIGFILFFLCDLNIELTFFTTTGLLPESLNGFFSFIAWFFYYPSQILIINSSMVSKD